MRIDLALRGDKLCPNLCSSPHVVQLFSALARSSLFYELMYFSLAIDDAFFPNLFTLVLLGKIHLGAGCVSGPDRYDFCP